MRAFIPLPNILGNSKADKYTVAAFNSVRYEKTDDNGKKYLLTAVEPYKNGVIVEREYI